MEKINEIIVLEGKYDREAVSKYVDAVIIKTDGFSVFNDPAKRELIKKAAMERGIIILTDSDSAGFAIRNYIKSFVPPECIKNAYIPPVKGKEKRKKTFSKEGLLGVEGMDGKTVLDALSRAGANFNGDTERENRITRLDFYKTGLYGGENSAVKRKQLLKKLELPEYLSVKDLIDMLNVLYTRENYYSLFDINGDLK